MNKIFAFILGLILLLFFGFGCGRQEIKIVGQSTLPAGETEKLLPKEPAWELMLSSVEVKSNPFLTEEEERTFADLGNRIPIDYLSISAILYSPSASRAIINGQILKKDDTIDNKEIIEIQPEAVILKDSQSEYIVKLKRLTEK